jgi:transcriptional regulator with GAF, ATPase, and Fis domain
MVPVNCGAIPEDLLESELFGHVKGSFTGAMNDRVGRFVMADGGTIFLDEIGDMSPKLQVKVLRVLQEQYVEPVGSAETIRVDVRILAATNVDLEKAVEEKRFREDLYYRLNVIPIHVAPFRERLEDLPLLIDHFIKCFNQRQPRRLDGFAPETIEILRNYDWPGNVRELENLVERMTILSCNSIVIPDDLPEKFQRARAVSERAVFSLGAFGRAASSGGRVESDGRAADQSQAGGLNPRAAGASTAGAPGFLLEGGDGAGPANLNDLVDRFEREMIVKALQRSNGVKNRAAQMLGIKRTTLVEKMKKKNIVFKRV